MKSIKFVIGFFVAMLSLGLFFGNSRNVVAQDNTYPYKVRVCWLWGGSKCGSWGSGNCEKKTVCQGESPTGS